MATHVLNKKIPFGVKLGYGTGSIISCVYYAFISTYGMYYLTDIAGITPAFGGIIFSLGIFWDAVSDPLIGNYSDNLESKWGRRRPILLASAVPFIIVCWLFATPFELSYSMKGVYYIILVILYYTAVTMADVPYSALGAEMTSDYNERISLNTYRSLFGQAGIAFSSILCLVIVDYATGYFSSEKIGWSVTGLLFGFMGGVAILICWRSTRGWERYHVEPEEDKTGANPIQVWKVVLKNRTFRWTALLFGVGTMQMVMYGALSTYYFLDVIGLNKELIAFTWTIFTVGQLISIPVTDIVAKKTSKMAAWIILNGICAVIIAVLYLFIIQPGTFLPLYIATIALGFTSNTIWQLSWAIIPDCVEVEEIVTGKRKEGVYYSVASFIQKAGNAAILLLVGGLLTFIGYNPQAKIQSAETLHGLKLCVGIGVPLFSLLTLIFAYKYPLSRSRYKAILSAIELKRAGKEYDKTVMENVY